MPRIRLVSSICSNNDGTATVDLTRGFKAIVDQDDINIVSRFKWHVKPSGNTHYAEAHAGVKHGRNTVITMHRLIANASHMEIVDHVNGNGLDNRKDNIRIGDATLNKLNERLRCDNSSGDSGIHRRPSGAWQARISINKKRVSLGHFTTYRDAKLCMDSVRSIIASLLEIRNPRESHK